jgi:ABC-type enterochelin transport system substrate-binding protein
MLEALIKRYEAQIAEAEATIEIYLSNSVGIGEHPQHIDELDKLFGKIAEAEDKVKVIERWESQ